MKRKGGPNPVDVYAGERVRRRRVDLGLSQSELGQRIGLTFQQIQKYEKGINRMGAGRLQQMAHVLMVPVPYFFDGAPLGGRSPDKPKDEIVSVSDVSKFLAMPEGRALAKALRRIEPDVRRAISALIEKIANGSKRR